MRFDIGWAEAVAVKLGLLIAIEHRMLEMISSDRASILVHSDNAGMVAIVSRS